MTDERKPVAGSGEHNTGPSSFIRDREFVDLLIH
jgi:hypothetical protein